MRTEFVYALNSKVTKVILTTFRLSFFMLFFIPTAKVFYLDKNRLLLTFGCSLERQANIKCSDSYKYFVLFSYLKIFLKQMFGEYLHFSVALLLLSTLITVGSNSLGKHRITNILLRAARQPKNSRNP